MKFCIFAYPRSRTAWLANWLTYDCITCEHEALASRSFAELDGTDGIADTIAPLFWRHIRRRWPECKFIVIERDPFDVMRSLERLGLDPSVVDRIDLSEIPGHRIRFEELDQHLELIWSLVHGTDYPKHREWLCGVKVELTPTALKSMKPNIRRLLAEASNG